MSLVLKITDGKVTSIPFADGDWYETQDKVFIENNIIRILGRKDETVKILGENVNIGYLRKKVEAWLLEDLEQSFAGKFKWALKAQGDLRAGKKLVLYFESGKSESKRLELQDYALRLQKEFNFKVLPFERITEICELPQIPRSDLGKILYGELK
jgi:O-succinylbenzoic acid--CoA ligase